MFLFWFVPILILVVIAWLIFVYNGLVRSRNNTEESWADIEVQLKRRYDLIPNLVETVKGYARHEAEIFQKVTEARTAAMQAKTMKERSKAENALSGTLKTLFAVAENYPDLKATQNFLQLQDELVDTENKIQAARRFYNNNVRIFNTKLQVFPTNLVASMLTFTAKEYFEIGSETEKEPVAVKF